MKSSDGYVAGYMTKDGMFLGYHGSMTMVPDLVPARMHLASGVVEATGHSRTIPKGEVLTTDDGFGNDGVVIGRGMVDNVGEGFAPKHGVQVILPDNDTGPEISDELAAKIAARETAAAAAKQTPVGVKPVGKN